MNRIQVVDYGTCGPCRKRRYRDRKDAKKVIRELPKDGPMREYRCPEDPEVWHVGHMSWNVVKGRITQREIYGR